MLSPNPQIRNLPNKSMNIHVPFYHKSVKEEGRFAIATLSLLFKDITVGLLMLNACGQPNHHSPVHIFNAGVECPIALPTVQAHLHSVTSTYCVTPIFKADNVELKSLHSGSCPIIHTNIIRSGISDETILNSNPLVQIRNGHLQAVF